VKASAIAQGLIMWTLLEDAQLWFDLEGAKGEGVDMGADFGVMGEDCEAMVVISESFKVRKAKGFGRRRTGAFRFKTTLLHPILSEM
jgi:hypothetical protein